MKPKSLLFSFATALCLTTVAGLEAQDPRPPIGSTGRPITAADSIALRKAAAAKLGQSVSQADMIEALRKSGLSRAEVRTRLRMQGFDPALADRYFDSIENGSVLPAGDVPEESLLALSNIGIRPPALTQRDTTRFGSQRDTSRFRGNGRDTLDADTLEVFGLRVFRNNSTQFEPNAFGPVDGSYRLGPGDELTLVLTGDVEEVYPLRVTREGQLFIPNVGQMSVNNLTLDQLRDALYSRLGVFYSGISRGSGATTRFQVSLGQLRANQVFITGDVAAPGAYQVSSVAGLFNALYQAGGPTAQGSFRRVQVSRGGRVVHTADLYDWLVRGDASSDIRIEQNDRIFVPPAGVQVRVEGAVRRPAIYEVKPNETVRDLLAYAGGLSSRALARRIQIDRILPPNEQTPGHYRKPVDVDLANPNERLVDGDVLRVFAVPDRRRSMVVLEGEVRTPGLYEWEQGQTLWSLLDRADGPGEAAYVPRVHIYRLVESDGSRQLIQAALTRDANGRPLNDVQLADGDSIVVFSRAELRMQDSVTIAGLVKEPDTYPFAAGMSLNDLVLAAQGFAQGASLLEAEVSRLPNPEDRTSRSALTYRVQLAAYDSVRRTQDASGYTQAAVPTWLPSPNEFRLQAGDHVFIRQAPGFIETRLVTIVGEVGAPGVYALEGRSERLSDIIARAKALTPEAYAAGIRIVRDSAVIAADLRKGLQDPDNPNNIMLEDGDSIIVPTFDPTVRITGAVMFPGKVVYVPGHDLNYYLAQAGGLTAKADRGRVAVVYPGGEKRAVKRGLFRSRDLTVTPGSEVVVPERPAGVTGTNWADVISRATAVLGTVATLLIAFSQLK